MARVRTPPPFHRLWTDRFWTSRRVHEHELITWHQELMHSHGDHIWYRMVINNWLGKPFSTPHEVLQTVNWLAEAGDPWVFATKRGRSDVHMGVQIWCVNPEVQLLVHMMAAPVKQVTSYTPEQFDSQMELILGWMLPP